MKNSAPKKEEKRDITFYIPAEDRQCAEWLKHQKDPYRSLQILIQDYIRQNGMTDTVTSGIKKQKRHIIKYPWMKLTVATQNNILNKISEHIRLLKDKT